MTTASLKRNILCIIILCIVLFSYNIFAIGTKDVNAVLSNIKLFLNDKKINKDVVVIKGTSYLPVRAISEALGLEVKWDESTKSINLNSETQESGNEAILKETLEQMKKKNGELQKEHDELQNQINPDTNENTVITRNSADLSPKVVVKSGGTTVVMTLDAVKSLITKKGSGTVSADININKMTESIYCELESKFGIEYTDEETLEKSIIDSLTTKVGVSGLLTFAERSNNILEKEWGLIYDQLGIPRQNQEGFGLDEKRYYNLVCYDSDVGTDININFRAYNDFKAIDGTSAEANYVIKFYKDGDWLPTFEASGVTEDSVQQKTFKIHEGGVYFVCVSRADWFDWISKIRCVCTIF